jgi:hypothetical protein
MQVDRAPIIAWIPALACLSVARSLLVVYRNISAGDVPSPPSALIILASILLSVFASCPMKMCEGIDQMRCTIMKAQYSQQCPKGELLSRPPSMQMFISNAHDISSISLMFMEMKLSHELPSLAKLRLHPT